jgi:phage tail-like protein
MADNTYPFTNFNFAVEIAVPDISTNICKAAFSDCDGLEMSMDVKTIREGGNNTKQIRLTGPTNYGTLTLKRGMTSDDFDLWKWFTAVQRNPNLRASAEVVIFAPDGQSERARFVLDRCLPVKLKAPALNAKDSAVAVEELQIAYESLSLKDEGGFGLSVSASFGANASFSAGIG